MDVVILHYHLQWGGVTQVIQNHLHALAELAPQERPSKVWVVSGSRAEGWNDKTTFGSLPVERIADDRFDYDSPRQALPQTQLTEALVEVLGRCQLDPSQTILHLHNPTLGKKAAWPTTVRTLADQGWRWLLQIHDFAEDFRPLNYEHLRLSQGHSSPSSFQQWLYPTGESIAYATLNSRDARILEWGGVSGSPIRILPNPLGNPIEAEQPQRHQEVSRRLAAVKKQQLVLYPVRGIRRKNVPEFMLWAKLFSGECQFAMTLPAETPTERRVYSACQEVAQECDLPIWWEVGLDSELDFSSWMASADRLLTTSVTEGFGMVFLEAWLWGKGLIGRDLPEITADFKAAGVRLEGLNDSVLVPMSWLDFDEVAEQLASRYHEACTQFHQSKSMGVIREEIENWLDDEEIDFAHLPFSQQLKMIRLIDSDPRRAAEIRSHNPWMELSLRRPVDAETLVHNRETIERVYGPRTIGGRLMAIYLELLGDHSPDLAAENGWNHVSNTDRSLVFPEIGTQQLVLDQFLSLDRFYPIRIE